MKKLLLFVFLIPALLQAQGGMWLPLYLEKNNEKEMKALGCHLDADALYSAGKPSVKDAICIFGGGCTADAISPEGLLLTNHHCGFGSIQSLSTVEKNYIENGYWAPDRTSELPCPGLTVTFVTRMEDVTTRALMGVSEIMSEKDRQSQIDKNLDAIVKSTKKEKYEEVISRPFYNGNQYFIFVTTVYKDIRFVGAPPSSIGKFGSDTDNWVWPRHTGDFSMFRIYAGKDNLPAEYSADNIPYTPKHFLPISLDGVQEGDFTMVYGFPGRTDEYLSASAVRQMGEVLDPARVAVRDKTLKTMDGFMRQDPTIKLAYIARYASIANSWKKWLGEMQGLKTYGALDKKKAYEQEFEKRINQNPDFKVRFGNILPRLNETYTTIEPYALARDYYLEVFVRNVELMSLCASLNSWVKLSETDPVSFAQKAPTIKGRLDRFYKNYYPEVDQAVFAGLTEIYAQNMPADWGGSFVKEQALAAGGYNELAQKMYSVSALTSVAKILPLFDLEPEALGKALSADPAIVFWNAVTAPYQTLVEPKYNEFQPTINLLQRQYMAAQMEVFKEKRFFPDANSTLRLTYGQVHGYSPRDAVYYQTHTYLDGVMEKYIPGDYEFDVPQKLRDLYAKKDFGRYAAPDGRMPVAFIATNHTTGGNSGSPALNADGYLVGLNFDRVWEGTMSDLNYDPAICRNIMVDIRYVLFIIDKYGDAGHLIDEMQLVQGKKKKSRK